MRGGTAAVHLSAASSPIRIDAIIPDAPQSNAISEMNPIAESGDDDPLDRALDVRLPFLGDRARRGAR